MGDLPGHMLEISRNQPSVHQSISLARGLDSFISSVSERGYHLVASTFISLSVCPVSLPIPKSAVPGAAISRHICNGQMSPQQERYAVFDRRSAKPRDEVSQSLLTNCLTESGMKDSACALRRWREPGLKVFLGDPEEDG